MKEAIRKIAMLFMVCGLAVSASWADWKDLPQYKELKMWIEDMKANHPMLKQTTLNGLKNMESILN